jgi:hypothetical protein
VLDERLALQVLRTVPGFELLTELMLRDCGVTDNSNLQTAALRALTLEPGRGLHSSTSQLNLSCF